MVNGTRHLHAVWDGVGYRDGTAVPADEQRCLFIHSTDAFLVAPGSIHKLLDFDGESQPEMINGMHFNLFNVRSCTEVDGCLSTDPDVGIFFVCAESLGHRVRSGNNL